MKYLPSIAIAVGIIVIVCFGLYMTHSIDCLYGLWAMLLAVIAIPRSCCCEDESEDEIEEKPGNENGSV